MITGTTTTTSAIGVLVFGPLEASATVTLKVGGLAAYLASESVDASTDAGKAASFNGFNNNDNAAHTVRMSQGDSLYIAASGSGSGASVTWIVSYD